MYIGKWVCMYSCVAYERRKRGFCVEVTQKSRTWQQSDLPTDFFVSILSRRVETAALYKCGQEFPLSVQSRRHFDWLCED